METEYTINDIAQELNKSYQTALNLVRTGKIQGRRFGGTWQVTKEEMDRFKRDGNHPDSMKGE